LVVVDKADGGDLMMSFSQFIAIIDFEATALSKSADVIEVGVAIYDRQEMIRTWSSLVRPSPDCVLSPVVSFGLPCFAPPRSRRPNARTS
jgi:hypothetical protein